MTEQLPTQPGWGPPPPPTRPPSAHRFRSWQVWAALGVAFILGTILGAAATGSDPTPTAAAPSTVERRLFTSNCQLVDPDNRQACEGFHQRVEEQLAQERADGVAEGRRTATTRPPQTTQPPQTTRPAPPPAPTFTDGVYEVGAEIKPGTYKTRGSGGGIGCYWARLRTPEDIIDNNISTGPMTMIIRSGDGFVEFSGGCEWRRA